MFNFLIIFLFTIASFGSTDKSIAVQIFQYSTQMSNGPLVTVSLLDADSELAQKYLDLVPQYINRYSKLIGPYGYSSFIVNETRSENTGEAFPGSTIFSSQLLRLPFLLRSSLPHEILHSWWGNGVLVDYKRGNWCEGLTTYMADLAFQIEDGHGVEFRRKQLEYFQDFAANGGEEQTLRQFVSRGEDRGKQAVGYGKALMFFQMLENLLGTDGFHKALSSFYQTYFGKEVSYQEIETVFSQQYGASLKSFFDLWLDQKGAPLVKLESAKGVRGELLFSLSQSGLTTPVIIPIQALVTLGDGSARTISFNLNGTTQQQDFHFTFGENIKALAIDPEFKSFRKLYEQEMPPALAKAFGERNLVTISVPKWSEKDLAPWIAGIKRIYPSPSNVKFQIIESGKPHSTSGTLWIIGSQNRDALPVREKLLSKGMSFPTADKISYAGKAVWAKSSSTVFMSEKIAGQPVEWIWTDDSQPGEKLTRKITHYAGFSLVGFTEAVNDITITWPLDQSPLAIKF